MHTKFTTTATVNRKVTLSDFNPGMRYRIIFQINQYCFQLTGIFKYGTANRAAFTLDHSEALVALRNTSMVYRGLVEEDYRLNGSEYLVNPKYVHVEDIKFMERLLTTSDWENLQVLRSQLSNP